ncbi:uncharacterized protein [Bos indicus]|uniref:Uncharacterized protein n=1 Tax=Bos indicus TaxID=9915 RepID=A0ABM4SJW4_BOSIN
MAALPRLLQLLLLLLAASSAALLAINAHSSCPGPLAIPCIPRSYSCHFRSALWACESAHPHAAPGAPAPADGAGPTPRLGVPLPQRGIGRREPERRGPSGLPGRTLAAHTPAEHPETRLASSSPQSLGQPQALSPIPLHTASLSRTACPPSAIRRYRRLRRQGSPWSVRIQAGSMSPWQPLERPPPTRSQMHRPAPQGLRDPAGTGAGPDWRKMERTAPQLARGAQR